MAAKLDKEMLKKQHFWLLLIPVCLGLLLAWLGLVFGVADATEEQANANREEKKKIESAKAQSKEILKLYETRKGELFDLRTKRWNEMWDLQQGMFEWPKSIGDDQIAKVKDKKFGTEISDPSFLDAFRDHYVKEYATLANDVAPLQFAGTWSSVLRHIPAWKKTPDSEDVWLAVEDYWIQKEIVTALGDINKEASRFVYIKQDKDSLRSRTFLNRIWQVDLQLVETPKGVAVEGTIKNRTDRLQPYNSTNELVLNVWLSDQPEVKPFRFAIEGGSLEGGKQEKIKFVEKKHIVLEGNPTGIYRVEQVYDPRTAPVKRLDKLELGYKSARHNQAELQMAAFSSAAVSGDTSTAGNTGTGKGPPGMGPIGMGPPMGGTLGPAPSGPGPGITGTPGASTSSDQTFNGLVRSRYISRTDQVRAVPIGIKVIADQAFVQDVFTAVANCKLRFQTVQTQLTRFRGSITYSGATKGGEDGLGPVPGMPPGMPPGIPTIPGVPGVPGMPGGAPRSSNEDQVAANMVDVTLYGIASLYEKFEPAKKDKDTTDTKESTVPVTPMPPAKSDTPMPPAKGETPTPPAKGDTPAKTDVPAKENPTTPTPPKM